MKWPMTRNALALLAVTSFVACVLPFDDSVDSGLVLTVGADSIVRTDASPEGACPAGGRVYSTGTDRNGDGVLQDDEVSSASLVCDGEDARPQRTRVTTVPTGDATCEAGGFLVGFGDDLDQNGFLDQAEVRTSLTICNGAPAPAGTTLDTLPGCVDGDVPRRGTDGTWACAPLSVYDGTNFALSSQDCPAPLVVTGVATDGTLLCDTRDDTLEALVCTVGQIAKWNGIAWACDVDQSADPGTDTLAGLTCASGQVAKWNGAAWSCADDTNTDTLMTLACVPGQVAKWNGTAWVCAADVDTNTLASLSCANGQLAKFNGSIWVCAVDLNTDTLTSLACAPGQVAKWNGAAWLCALDVDTNTDTLAGLTCVAGQVAKWNGTSWACAPDIDTNTDTLAALVCAPGQVAKWNGTSWACAPDIDTNTDTLASLVCAPGQVAKWNGAAWACAIDTDTLAALVCATGQVAKWNGTSWACAIDTDTLAGLSCQSGEIAKYNGSGWVCALDDDGAATLFFRTLHVQASGTPTENGTLLRNMLAAIVAPSSTNRFLLKLEPGVYDIGATALPLRAYVDIEGAGERATVITGTADGTVGHAVVIGANNVTLRLLGITGSGATVRVLSSTAALPELDRVVVTASGTVSVSAVSLATLGALTTPRSWRAVTLDVTGGGASVCNGLTLLAPQTSPSVRVSDMAVFMRGCVSGVGFDVPPAWGVTGARVELDATQDLATLTGARVAGALSGAQLQVTTLGASSSTIVGVQCSGTTGSIHASRVVSSGAVTASVTVQAFQVPATTNCTLVGNSASLTGASDAFGVRVAAGGVAVVSSSDLLVNGSVTAFGVWSGGDARVRQVSLRTQTVGGAAVFVDTGTSRCDNCVLDGWPSAVVANGTAFLGASRVGGTVTGTGTVKCVASYDAAYDPLVCP